MLARVLLCRHSAPDTSFPLPESRQGTEERSSTLLRTPTAGQVADDMKPGPPFLVSRAWGQSQACCLQSSRSQRPSQLKLISVTKGL